MWVLGVGGEWVSCGCEAWVPCGLAGGGGVWGFEHRRTPTLPVCLPTQQVPRLGTWVLGYLPAFLSGPTDEDAVHHCYHGPAVPATVHHQLLSRNVVPSLPLSGPHFHDTWVAWAQHAGDGPTGWWITFHGSTAIVFAARNPTISTNLMRSPFSRLTTYARNTTAQGPRGHPLFTQIPQCTKL